MEPLSRSQMMVAVKSKTKSKIQNSTTKRTSSPSKLDPNSAKSRRIEVIIDDVPDMSAIVSDIIDQHCHAENISDNTLLLQPDISYTEFGDELQHSTSVVTQQEEISKLQPPPQWMLSMTDLESPQEGMPMSFLPSSAMEPLSRSRMMVSLKGKTKNKTKNSTKKHRPSPSTLDLNSAKSCHTEVLLPSPSRLLPTSLSTLPSASDIFPSNSANFVTTPYGPLLSPLTLPLQIPPLTLNDAFAMPFQPLLSLQSLPLQIFPSTSNDSIAITMPKCPSLSPLSSPSKMPPLTLNNSIPFTIPNGPPLLPLSLLSQISPSTSNNFVAMPNGTFLLPQSLPPLIRSSTSNNAVTITMRNGPSFSPPPSSSQICPSASKEAVKTTMQNGMSLLPLTSPSQKPPSTSKDAIPTIVSKDNFKQIYNRVTASSQRLKRLKRIGRSKDPKSKKSLPTLKPQKEMGKRCQCKSNRLHCGTINETERRHLFEEFWSLDSWEAKKLYMRNFVTVRKQEATQKNVFKYFLGTEKKSEVCRQMFLNTFAIARRSIREWCAPIEKRCGLWCNPSQIPPSISNDSVTITTPNGTSLSSQSSPSQKPPSTSNNSITIKMPNDTSLSPLSSPSQIPPSTSNNAVPTTAPKDSFKFKQNYNHVTASSQRLKRLKYIGRSKDPESKKALPTLKPKKEMGKRCQCKSNRLHCGTINETERRHLFEEFWSLDTWEARKLYVRNLVTVTKQKATQKNVFKCFLGKEKKSAVCRKMFLNTFAIARRSVKEWCKQDSVITTEKRHGLWCDPPQIPPSTSNDSVTITTPNSTSISSQPSTSQIPSSTSKGAVTITTSNGTSLLPLSSPSQIPSSTSNDAITMPNDSALSPLSSPWQIAPSTSNNAVTNTTSNGTSLSSQSSPSQIPSTTSNDSITITTSNETSLLPQSSPSQIPPSTSNDSITITTSNETSLLPQSSPSQIPPSTSNDAVPTTVPKDSFKQIYNHVTASSRRLKGLKYIGRPKDPESKKSLPTLMPQKEMGKRCQCKANWRHCGTINETERRHLFEEFWSLDSWEAKKLYVRNLVNVTKQEATQKTVFKYFLGKEKKSEVCKEMFINTLAIGKWSVREWCTQDSVKTTEKRRGSWCDRAKDQKSACENFLHKLNKMPSHCCKKSTEKEYLDRNFRSIQDVFEVYVDSCTADGTIPLSLPSFNRIFNNTNIGIFMQQKDQCDICVAHENGNLCTIEWNDHQEREQEAHSAKAQDKLLAEQDKAIMAVCMDLQPVLLSPAIRSSSLYFKTKLRVYNFTFVELTKKKVDCYVWHEVEGGETEAEFASCVYDYLETNAKDKKLVILYSDGCCHRNRNAILSKALSHFSVKEQVILEQKYLEEGHTQMECHFIHAVIEKKLKGQDIYSPSDYVRIIKAARKTISPYNVHYLEHRFFQDFTEVSSLNSIIPRRKAANAKVTDLRGLRYTPDGDIYFKLNHSNDWEALPKEENEKYHHSVDHIKLLHKQPLKITNKKYRDLQEMKGVLPNDVHSFYDQLPHL